MTRESPVTVSVFVRRLKEGRAFAEFIEEWEADEGFGVPTRVFNAQSLDDPRNVISIGFVDIAADQLEKRLAEVVAQEHVRRADRYGRRVDDAALHVRDARRARLHDNAAGGCLGLA